MITVRVHEGALVNVTADVIVNSSNTALFLDFGGASKAILKAAGPGLQDECSRKYPDGIDFGQVAVTDGYNLKCKRVYHIALPQWNSDHIDVLQLLFETMHACLTEAHESGMVSMAMPTLGCGFLGYPQDTVAQTIMQCVTLFEDRTPQCSLKQIVIVIFNQGALWKQIKQSFVQALRSHDIQPQRSSFSSIFAFFSGKGNTTNSQSDDPSSATRVKLDFLSTCRRERVTNDCRKVLPCDHKCCGYRNEKTCPPCLQPGCTKQNQTSKDDCIICYTDPLSAAPVIMLRCGHVFHLHCAKRVLQSRWIGARINFNFTHCPICQARMEHVELETIMAPIKQLEDDIRKKAMTRLKFEGLEDSPAIINRKGKFYRKPHEFAMDKYVYYLCFKCQKAYYGATANNECGELESIHYKPEEYVCSDCRGSGKPTEMDMPSDRAVAKGLKHFDKDREMIHKTTKACPHCGARTEKDGGCMHMTCIKCHCDWCWLCETNWEERCRREHWFG